MSAPTRRAFVTAIDAVKSQYDRDYQTSKSAIPSRPAPSLSISPSTAAREVSLMFDPDLLITSYSARSIAFCTPRSGVLDPVTSSIRQ